MKGIFGLFTGELIMLSLAGVVVVYVLSFMVLFPEPANIMITTTIPFAISNSGNLFNASYDCENFAADFLRNVDDGREWYFVDGVKGSQLHAWVATNISGETFWFEPQTGFVVNEWLGYNAFGYNNWMFCCGSYNKFGEDICECKMPY